MKMDQMDAVCKMQKYIEDHLEEKITSADLAKVSQYSPWYSYRLFKEYTGLTPSAYIRRLRLSYSAVRLKNNHSKVIDVAYELGYGSVDGYQRAFYKEFGCNPGEYSRTLQTIPLFLPYNVKFREVRKEYAAMKDVQSVFIQIQKKPERKCIIKRGVNAEEYFAYCNEAGCDVWEVLTSMDSICGEPVCLWLPEAFINPGTSKYVQGVEAVADYSGSIPDGFDVITLPEAEYLVFQGEPFQEEDYEEAIHALCQAIEKYDPAVIGYQWDHSSPRIQLEPRGERGYIELRPVKKL